MSFAETFDRRPSAPVVRDYPSLRHGGHYLINYYIPPAPSSTPWAPAWSPDTEEVAIAISGSIWSVELESGVATELTYGDKYHSSPSWSPDGQTIVYTADDGGNSIQLEILDVSTGKSYALTDDGFVYADPAFSPDGKMIAYAATTPSGYLNVYVRAICGTEWCGNEVAVTTDHKSFESRPYYGEYDMHAQPAWFPDARKLVLTSNEGVLVGSGNVIAVPTSTKHRSSDQIILAEEAHYRTRPHVSPDGKQLVYSSNENAGEEVHNLYLLDLTTEERRRLTSFGHDAFHPRWSPDGRLISYIDNRNGLPQLAIFDTTSAENRVIEIKDRRWKRPMGFLRLRTTADGGSGVSARVHLVAADGKFYAPSSQYARVAGSSGAAYFHTPGEVVVALPAGNADVEIVKGFEHWPERRKIGIDAGKTTDVVVAMRRFEDMAAKGWINGSTHVHMNYGGNFHNIPSNMIEIASAEDLDIINVLSATKDNIIFDSELFSPSQIVHEASTVDQLMIIGQEYRSPFYGHVSFLGIKESLLMPYTERDKGIVSGDFWPSNTDVLLTAKRQGATVGYAHAFQTHGWTYAPDFDPLDGDLFAARAFVVDAALGATDLIEWSQAGGSGFAPWFATLNNGIFVAAAGGEDSITDLHRGKVMGAFRTYAYTGDKGIDADAWLSALKSGRTFVSSGPLLEFTVNDAIPGSTIELQSADTGSIHLQAMVKSVTPLTSVSIIFNGEVLSELPLDENRLGANFDRTIEVSTSGWLLLMAQGVPAETAPFDTTYAQAFTNPVWIELDSVPVRDLAAAKYCIDWIEKLYAMITRESKWRSAEIRNRLLGHLHDAKNVYQKLVHEAEH